MSEMSSTPGALPEPPLSAMSTAVTLPRTRSGTAT